MPGDIKITVLGGNANFGNVMQGSENFIGQVSTPSRLRDEGQDRKETTDGTGRPDVLTGVFISYRQDDAKPWAMLLRDELGRLLGDEHIFFDKDTLHAGNWCEQIKEALNHCHIVLVIIGRRWLNITDENGQRRLNQLDDVHRSEIALALSRNDVTVIPVLVDGAAMPQKDCLPDDIKSLTDQQSRELSDNSARREVDIKFLLDDIDRAIGFSLPKL